MTKKNKKPVSETANAVKTPKKAENPDSYHSKSPSWGFSKMDNEHEQWSFTKNNVFSNDTILKRLSAFETQTWTEIKGDRNHEIEIHEMIKDARDRILELGLHYDSLFSLTVNGKERIFGILENGVLSFLWYDEKHEICPSHKKHT